MLLVFTSDELERLAEKFSAKKPSIEFLGNNQVRVKASSVSIKLFLEEVQPRRLTFSYKMNVIIKFFAEQFISLDKPGLIWEKEADRFHLDFDQMPQDDKIKDFFIKQMIIDDQKMIIDFDFYQPLEQLDFES
jgi:hypothetical protein